MPEIIEIPEDSKDDDNRVTTTEPVIYVLDDPSSYPDPNQQVNYPSSPRPNINVEDRSIEILETNSCSSEILIPFCHELSSNPRSDSSNFQIRQKISKDTPNKRQKDNLLDKIFNGNSSVDLSTEKTEENAVENLRDVAPKWSKSNSNVSAGSVADKHSEFTPSGPSQNVLEDFPLSSPVIEHSVHETAANWTLSIDDKKEDLVFQRPSVEAPKAVILTQTDQADSPKSKHETRHNAKFRLPSERPATVELNLSKFLSDKTWVEKPSSPRRKSNRVKKPDNNPPRVISRNWELEKTALHQYILHGEYYSKQKSESLLRYWLKENKRMLKQANQIYRSNEGARSCIIIEVSSGLLEALQEMTGEIESLISPATLQVGYDNSLPRIRFLRRITSIYDFNHDIYYPTDLKIMEENVNVLVYDAQKFFELYRNEKKQLFDMIQSFSKSKKYLIVVLSDLNRLKRSVESLEDTKYKARVKEQLTGSQVASNRNKKTEAIRNLKMKTFDLEQRLRHIDRLWNVKLHVVNSTMEFINTLPNLLSIIGRQRMDPAIRFMKYSHIHVRSSKDRTDALKQTLHHLNKMPELKCNAVTNAYPNFQSLFCDLNKNQLKSGLDGKHLMTEAMESRLHKLFTCRDPNETIQ